MTTAIMAAPSAPRTPSVRRDPVLSVFLPKEHGSWSLALEPLVLGLLIAPSWAGGALAGAVLAGFFARRPLKAALTPLPSARRQLARATLVLWLVLAVVGLGEAGILGGWTQLWPLLPAAAFGLLFVRFDAQGDSRAAFAEIAGSMAFAFVPAAVAALAGLPWAVALVLAVLAAARSLPAILTVRASLRAAKGETMGGTAPLLASLLAFAVVTLLVAQGRAPLLAGALTALLLLRTVWLVGPWRPAWPARRIGQMEAALGLLYVVLIAAHWPST